MLPTFAASSALDVAREVARKVPETLPDSALTLYSALIAAAVETARRRGYSPRISHVTFHCPLEQVAKACGIDRSTVWRHLPALQALGLVDWRTHKGAFFGSTRSTGTVWQVRLNPVRGSRARLTRDDLRHKWRDLEADYRRYKLSSLTLKKHAATYTKDSPNIDLILAWSAPLPPRHSAIPVSSVCCKPPRASLEALLDVKTAHRQERSRMVSLAADALAQALSDHNSVSFYQKLLWNALRRFDATGEDHFYSVYLAAQRAATDNREQFARKAGALLVSRLKSAPWYEATMNAPPSRVGTKPIHA